MVKVAKAVWSSDSAYAKRLVWLHALADAHLRFVAGKLVRFDFQCFEAALALAKSKYLGHRERQVIREAEGNESSSTHMSHRIERVEAKAALWIPKLRFLLYMR